jgi:hypothetical protein
MGSACRTRRHRFKFKIRPITKQTASAATRLPAKMQIQMKSTPRMPSPFDFDELSRSFTFASV